MVNWWGMLSKWHSLLVSIRSLESLSLCGVPLGERLATQISFTSTARMFAPHSSQREVFAAVAERLKTNKEQASRNTKRPEGSALRSGLALCGHCGRKLGVRWGTGNSGKGYRVRVCLHLHCTQAIPSSL